MFGKKNKTTIDLQDDKEREARELAALEASLDFLKRPAKPAEDETQAEGGVKEVTAADRARAQKFGRRMDYKTAVVKRGSNSENEEASGETQEAAEEVIQEENVTAGVEAVTETEDKAEEVKETPVEEAAADAAAETEEEAVAEVSGEAEAVSDDKDEAEEVAEVKEEEKTGGLIIAEAPVPDTGEEAPKLIDNPLPTPKKHVPKDMDFDLEPDPDHMHFDVVDMKGKDFFDI